MIAQFLSDEQFAELWLQTNVIGAGEEVPEIADRVQAWLSRHDMGHRRPWAIALQVAKLSKPAPAPDPAEAARLDDVREGFGDTQILDVNSMTMDEFAAYRRQIGLGQRTDDGIFGPVGN